MGKDHTYSIDKSSKELKEKLNYLEDHLNKSKIRLKIEKVTSSRLKIRLANLQKVVSSQRKKLEEAAQRKKLDEAAQRKKLNEAAHEKFTDDAMGMLRRMMQNQKKGILTKISYSPVIREFASTVYGHNIDAYKYVRKFFNNALPHPSIIRKWHRDEEKDPILKSLLAPEESRQCCHRHSCQNKVRCNHKKRKDSTTVSLKQKLQQQRIHCTSPNQADFISIVSNFIIYWLFIYLFVHDFIFSFPIQGSHNTCTGSTFACNDNGIGSPIFLLLHSL